MLNQAFDKASVLNNSNFYTIQQTFFLFYKQWNLSVVQDIGQFRLTFDPVSGVQFRFSSGPVPVHFRIWLSSSTETIRFLFSFALVRHL